MNEPLRLSTCQSRAAGEPHARGLLLPKSRGRFLVATGAPLVRSLVALQQAPLDFSRRTAPMQATAPPNGSDWSVRRAFFEVCPANLPAAGVVAAGAMMGPPGHVESDSGHGVDRRSKESALSAARSAAMNVIAPGTFAALGIPIARRRDFDDGDRCAPPHVVVINEALAGPRSRADPIVRVIIAGTIRWIR